MHWTAFLAYRRFPANARVVDDMACIGCGYNLRGLSVWARCPECGAEAGNSLFLLARAPFVGRWLRTAGWSYLGLLGLLTMCVGGAWLAWLAIVGVPLISSIFRVFASSELRFRGALARLPIVGPRLHMWWICTLAELTSAAALAIVGYVGTMPGTGPPVLSLMIWMLLVNWAMTMASLVLASRFGRALVDMIEFEWTRIGFQVHRWIIIVFALVGLVLMVSLASSALTGVGRAIVGALLVASVAAASGLTGVVLLHAASAAEQSSETIDDVLDSERVAALPDPRPRTVAEPPPIKLED